MNINNITLQMAPTPTVIPPHLGSWDYWEMGEGTNGANSPTDTRQESSLDHTLPLYG